MALEMHRGEKKRLLAADPAEISLLLTPSDVTLSVCCVLQSKYKEDGVRSRSHSVYSQLAETAETQFAKNVSELQSEVGPNKKCKMRPPLSLFNPSSDALSGWNH